MESIKIGILGGGQLGLMMQQACSDWHLKPSYLDPDPGACVKPYGYVVCGDFKDYNTVMAFGMDLDLISFEIENVNIEALKALESMGKQVYPQPHVLEIIQNKWRQKLFLVENGLDTADFIPWPGAKTQELSAYLPAFWKQNEGGYDGKGVLKIESENELEAIPPVPGFLERQVNIQKEIAVLISRNKKGEMAVYPLVEQVFHPGAHLVEYLQSPAILPESIGLQCINIAKKLITKLDMIGLLAVELFITPSGSILVNEMAPRPHNSGHHTIEGCQTSQFQQFWRAILNLPPGTTQMVYPYAAMVNLVGRPGYEGPPVYEGIEACLKVPGVSVHLYGKPQTRPYRKMGHATIVASTLEELHQSVSFVRNHLKVIA